MTFVAVETDDPVATITLDGPSGNRISFQMREELDTAVDKVAASGARALLVTGAGADFCLGGDVRQWVGVPPKELQPKVAVYFRALQKLERLPLPTIAAVQGTCAGGGFELALSCDLILAAESARFTFPEAHLGIMTLQGGVLQLAERIGPTKAFEVVALGDPQPAHRLAGWNLLSKVVPDADLTAEAVAWADRPSQGPTATYAATKSLLALRRSAGHEAALSQLYALSMPLFARDEVQEAIRRAAEAANAGQPVPAAPSGWTWP
ncbi:enoyl-CoA hydratase/isomerase family protein [Streptomyces sp. NBC_01198]|uniref:enoyl-CoA hydratase/isomerase family protein n=1 Tax=Streptomyces sp. NBC_01198 TaxID=2903769 RepID=UPI002E164C27|nr:enoyl-CoA hydratase/isomerase family protein [Streptomyces sp. NBC_01198]